MQRQIFFYTSGGKSKTDIVMYKPSSTTYDYIWGAFFSSCSGNGTKDHSTQPALKAVSCTDIATGAGGHRYGLCQMGAALRAKMVIPHRIFCCIITLIAGSYPAH